jgi:hypothetical protein
MLQDDVNVYAESPRDKAVRAANYPFPSVRIESFLFDVPLESVGEEFGVRNAEGEVIACQSREDAVNLAATMDGSSVVSRPLYRTGPIPLNPAYAKPGQRQERRQP